VVRQCALIQRTVLDLHINHPDSAQAISTVPTAEVKRPGSVVSQVPGGLTVDCAWSGGLYMPLVESTTEGLGENRAAAPAIAARAGHDVSARTSGRQPRARRYPVPTTWVFSLGGATGCSRGSPTRTVSELSQSSMITGCLDALRKVSCAIACFRTSLTSHCSRVKLAATRPKPSRTNSSMRWRLTRACPKFTPSWK
jgi:hypothetical protein